MPARRFVNWSNKGKEGGRKGVAGGGGCTWGWQMHLAPCLLLLKAKELRRFHWTLQIACPLDHLHQKVAQARSPGRTCATATLLHPQSTFSQHCEVPHKPLTVKGSSSFEIVHHQATSLACLSIGDRGVGAGRQVQPS